MYIDDKDTDGQNLLIPGCSEKIVIIMIYSDYCGYCTQAMPAFNEFADKYRQYVIALKCDVNDPRGKAFLEKIRYNPTAVPDFLKFRNCQRVEEKLRGRSLQDFVNFIY